MIRLGKKKILLMTLLSAVTMQRSQKCSFKESIYGQVCMGLIIFFIQTRCNPWGSDLVLPALKIKKKSLSRCGTYLFYQPTPVPII